MKSKILFSAILLLITLSFVPVSYSQLPTANWVLTNDVMVDSKTWTVDIYFQSTAADPLEFATATVGLQFPDAFRNGGTITGSIVAGSSELSNTAQIPTVVNLTGTSLVNSVTMRLIKIAGKTPPSIGNGSMISTAAPNGTRYITLKLVNTVDWPTAPYPQPNSIDLAVTGYPSSFNVYVNGTNTNIISNVTLVKKLTSGFLPVELTSFLSNVSGRQVNLSWESKTEANSNKYEIERTFVNTKDVKTTWTSVGVVQAAGSSTSPRKYSFSEKNLQAGKYQYRLKIIDFDGSYKFSDIIETEIALPKDFAVSQNYPNPFNPSTTIAYQVPVDAKVIMEVYNIAGQKVSELVNQEMSAGYYTANFGASNLSSGVYIYRVVAIDKASGNNFSSIKKMMLLK